MESSDFGLLVTLDALLQEGSVTGAARRLRLSTPAVSHALARIRERLGDPILVRAGRGMVLTPRAESMKTQVRAVVEEARRALEPKRPFVARELERTFVVHTTDYVMTVLGVPFDRILRKEAPSVRVRFVPNTTEDASMLREGGSDLAIGIYGELPQEMRSRQLMTERFVCVVRERHPQVGARLSLEQYVQLKHVQVAPRGLPGGYLDDVLREAGLTRHVARAVPYFVSALQLVSETDYVLTIGERIASRLAESFGLRVLDVPLELRPYALSLVWHPRFDADDGHRFLRDVLTRAAEEHVGPAHPRPRVRLDASDPTSGKGRRRPRPLPKLHGTKS
jgi:DNA-binding transcriptional LysR family regulator